MFIAARVTRERESLHLSRFRVTHRIQRYNRCKDDDKKKKEQAAIFNDELIYISIYTIRCLSLFIRRFVNLPKRRENQVDNKYSLSLSLVLVRINFQKKNHVRRSSTKKKEIMKLSLHRMRSMKSNPIIKKKKKAPNENPFHSYFKLERGGWLYMHVLLR